MTKDEVRTRIEEVGIVPAIRVSSLEDAMFAARTVYRAGIRIAEVTMTTPGALQVISQLSQDLPDMVVGAGTVLDLETAQRSLDVGASFLTSPGLVLEVVDFAVKQNVVVFPGALTPTEVITAWKAGVDYVKIFPCAQVGGASYIKALKTPLPHIPLIASGGVDQHTTPGFIRAGATALGVGNELIPHEALQNRHESQVFELARRFVTMVRDTRAERTL